MSIAYLEAQQDELSLDKISLMLQFIEECDALMQPETPPEGAAPAGGALPLPEGAEGPGESLPPGPQGLPMPEGMMAEPGMAGPPAAPPTLPI